MQLHELIPTGTLIQAVEKGLVRATRHPSLPLMIYNYTDRAVIDKAWDVATLNCRGLIVNLDTEEIVARPFPKFFNYGEPDCPPIRPTGLVEVTDKLDGSLGILYETQYGGRYAVATRGSFTSDQALHASRMFEQGGKYHGFWVAGGWTLLFEIVYPENRIVVDYGDQDDLVLLGAVNIETGESAGPAAVPGWPGPRAEVFSYSCLQDALEAPPRPGKEGLVVRHLRTHTRIKLKQEDYVQLHRIVTGLNDRAIWERLRDSGRDIDVVLEGIPDELHPWVYKVADELAGRFTMREMLATSEFDRLFDDMHPWEDRGDFARRVKDFQPWLKTCMFLLLDGKSIDDFLWKQLRPAGETKRAWISKEDWREQPRQVRHHLSDLSVPAEP